MSDIQEYIQKVMWYASMEYDIPMVSVEDFESMPHSNVFMSHVLNFFLQNKPFQNCACFLVESVMQDMGLRSRLVEEPESN